MEPEKPGFGRAFCILGANADDAVARNEVLLFQNEHAAYAFLRRAQSSAAPAFHSSDTPLVELLVARLQERYELT